MNNRTRVMVFGVGFLLGMLLVSVILKRRSFNESVAEDPWVEHNVAAIEAGAEPLPEAVPQALKVGKIIDFGYLPDRVNVQEKVWHLSFDKSYPYVRLTEDIETEALEYMAADQILLKLADGVDVTALRPLLDKHELRLRMFNRKENIAVIGVLDTSIDAVPRTIQAMQEYSDLFFVVEPDYIRVKQEH